MSKYRSESDLCQEKIDLLRSLGWQVYPEFDIWDFFCELKTKRKTWTLGIQAKLKWNITLLRQCIESKPYAHWTVALVGNKGKHATNREYQTVCNELGILYHYGTWDSSFWTLEYFIGITKKYRDKKYNFRRNNLKNPYNSKPIIKNTPDFQPDLPGGVPAPPGYPTPFTLGVRKLVENLLSVHRPITIKQASEISGLPPTSVRHVFDKIAVITGKEGRAYTYILKPNGLQLAQKHYASGWLDQFAVES